MAVAKPNLTRPLPRPAPRRPKRPVRIAGPASPGPFTIQDGTAFQLRAWIAFDGPTVAAPNWIDITGYVETESTLTITRGRSDGLSDVNAGTLSLTVDNSDGRFSPANPNGAWYGAVHKGNWIKIQLMTASGKVSDRFTGFITGLPTGWSGQYASSVITASDRFEKLGNAPALISMIQHEVMSDPNLAGNVLGYWNLHETQGSLTFGDTSGNSAPHLTAYAAGGAAVGAGLTAQAVNAPGFDGLKTVSFSPLSSTQGTYLATTVTFPVGTWTPYYAGVLGTLELWYQATSPGTTQYIAGLVDLNAGYAIEILQHSSGSITVAAAPTNPGAPPFYTIPPTSLFTNPPRIDDGAWHHIVFGAASIGGAGLQTDAILVVDGVSTTSLAMLSRGSGALSQLIVGGGWDPSTTGVFRPGAFNLSDVAWTWASDPWTSGLSVTMAPDYYNHAAAGLSGFYGESTDARTARVARYAGVPVPTIAVTPAYPNWPIPTTVQAYSHAPGAWTNLSPGAHLCGTQSMSGRAPLDVMREAARTEGMPGYVDRSGYLALQSSTIRQNTSPAWTVDARDLDPSTALADDFTYTKNMLTVTPNQQAAQTVIGTVGQASISKYGVYSGSIATANINPVEARSLGLGVIQLEADPAPRLAPIVVEAATLSTQAGYGTAWYDAVLASDISSPVRVTNTPAAAGGGSMDALIEGYTETITAGNQVIALNTSPIQGPTYQLDDAVLGHIDTDGTILSTGYGTTDTVMSFTTVNASVGVPVWTVDAGDMPFDVNIGGERVTVTAPAGLTYGTADGTFESGVGGWQTTGGTLTQTSADKYAGTYSGLFTATSGGTMKLQTQANQIPVTPFVNYTLTMWVKATSGVTSVLGRAEFYNSGNSLILADITSSSTVQGSWIQLTMTIQAPVGSAYVLIGPVANVTASGNFIYVDNVVWQLANGPQTFAVTRSVNGVVASHAGGTAVSLWTPLTLAY